MEKKLLGVYAAKHKDPVIRADSRSGGFFTAISDYVFSNGGVVYGCVLNEKFEAVHVRAEDSKTRDAMRGSKYVQSKMGNTFRNIKTDLEAGRTVLFSGTSCQVAGLRKFLNKDYAGLICVDIVCHGTPSPRVWREYLAWQEKRIGKKVSRVDFRNKKDFGWAAHKETLYMDDGSSVTDEVFKNVFYGHYALRESCYCCRWKSIYHPGDITIADYWGVDKAAPGFNDNKGVSLLLIHSEKGLDVFSHVEDVLELRSTKIEDSMQPPLKAPFPRPQDRERFWKMLDQKGFEKVAVAFGDYGYRNKMKHLYKRGVGKLKRIAKRVLWKKG